MRRFEYHEAATLEEASELLPNLGPVYCESGWCFQSRIVEFAQQLPKDRIVFGTDSPPNDPGMWLRELEVLCHAPPQGMNLSEEDLEGYLGNNIARLVGIDPTPPPRDRKDAEARLNDTYAGVDRATSRHLEAV